MQNFSSVQKVTVSGICIALYVILMLYNQSFAFGQYQVRIATALYALGAVFPFLIIPLGVANALSNILLGGLGVLDMFGGAFVGVLTTYVIAKFRNTVYRHYIVWAAITFIPGLLVPVWLSLLLDLPYMILAVSLLTGQAIAGAVGVALSMFFEKYKIVILNKN